MRFCPTRRVRSWLLQTSSSAEKKEEEEQTEEESLGVFVTSERREGIKINAKIFTLEKDLYYPLSSAFAINSARTKAPRFRGGEKSGVWI